MRRPDPTPEDIAQAAARIRAGWSETTRRQRRVDNLHEPEPPVETPVVSLGLPDMKVNPWCLPGE